MSNLKNLFSQHQQSEKVLIHYHLFKNAGSSTDRILKSGFKGNWKYFDGPKASSILTSEELKEFLRNNSYLKAVSSHQVRPPLPNNNCYPIVFLRHPIDRLRSVFNFVLRDANQPNHQVAKEGGFKGYVQWVLEGSGGGRSVVRDYQVLHLSNASFRPPHCATLEDLEQVKGLLNEWGVFGIVRRFNESLVLYEKFYGKHFPEIDWSPVKVNVTNQSYVSDDDEMLKIQTLLGDELYGEILKLNQLDLELYKFAIAKFEALLLTA